MRYINHDTSALDDEKLTELIAEHGYEGYGLFWAILEKMGKQEKPVKTAVLKRQLKVGKKLEKCWKFMESIGLIHSNNGDSFNEQLLNYAGKYKIFQEKNAERVSKWRDNQKDKNSVTHYERVRNAPKENIIEVNESKENNSLSADALLQAQSEVEKLKIELEEERKKLAAKKKEDEDEKTPHWKAVKNEWTDFYGKNFNGAVPYFDAVSGTALKGIMKKLKARIRNFPATENEVWTQEAAVKYLNLFLTRASKRGWLMDNFRLENLNKQFDSIVDAKNNGQSTSNKPATGASVSTASAFDAIDEMYRHAGSGGQ